MSGVGLQKNTGIRFRSSGSPIGVGDDVVWCHHSQHAPDRNKRRFPAIILNAPRRR